MRESVHHPIRTDSAAATVSSIISISDRANKEIVVRRCVGFGDASCALEGVGPSLNLTLVVGPLRPHVGTVIRVGVSWVAETNSCVYVRIF